MQNTAQKAQKAHFAPRVINSLRKEKKPKTSSFPSFSTSIKQKHIMLNRKGNK